MTVRTWRAPAGCSVHGLSRRRFVAWAGGSALASMMAGSEALAAVVAEPRNLALVATASASGMVMPSLLARLNDGYDPTSSGDRPATSFNFGEEPGNHWVQYDWDQPVMLDRIDLFWHEKSWGLAPATACRLLFWDGRGFVPVRDARGLGLDENRYNTTRFAPVRTARLRLEVAGDKHGVGILQWRASGPGPVPSFAPVVAAGPDRTVVLGGRTYLSAQVKRLSPAPGDSVRWRQLDGPGPLAFDDPAAVETSAVATLPGDYRVEVAATSGGRTSRSTLRLRAQAGPPAERLEVVYTRPHAITSPFWRARAKALIVNWIPHCVAFCERTDLPKGEGGLDNFIEAAKALRGEPHAAHKGYVFSNAWVHQTVESMCIALMVDAAGDPEMLAAQQQMRVALERWIPIVLAAQHPDGYLQTAYTLADRAKWPERWSPAQRGNHEGYVSGYFIESAINHYTMTGGNDRRLYDAAKRLADCWVANIGPDRKPWFDGHQEMEQALVRFGRFVNDMEGNGRGDAYIALARFLLESRRGGSEYDQSHLPPRQQYEAVGHAVRAVYFYSGMADIAAETGDRDYQSAVASLWDNLVNRKYYVTGGVGSGDSPEGFGDDYALKNDAYCESCSSCGLIFFQYKLNLAYHDARYADLYEETMYNALLGATDLAGQNYTYTNPLVNTERYAWHTCPCCVGNISRTLLMLPTWTYAKSRAALYVNLFVGSRIDVGEVAGTPIEMVQETDYPWAGAVGLTVNPARPSRFALHIRVPDRDTSTLYAAEPQVSGLKRLTLNGQPIEPRIANGYAVIEREWRPGDHVAIELPMAAQRVRSTEAVAATRGRQALRYGPLIYNTELADQPRIDLAVGTGPLTTEWRSDLLGGVAVIRGRWADGSPLTAIPNYARTNRVGPDTEFPSGRLDGQQLSQVWMAST
jgi:hypothetical protein